MLKHRSTTGEMEAWAIIGMEVSLGDFFLKAIWIVYSKLQESITIFFYLRAICEKSLATRETN